jgi:hypothetical protein
MKKSLWLSFFPWWILVNGVGWFALKLVPFYRGFLYYFGFSLGIGLFLACLQWMVLDNYFGSETAWIWYSFFPYGLFYFLSLWLDNFWLVLLVASLVFGISGFVQWRVITFYLPNADMWLAVSPLAALVSISLASFLTGYGVAHYQIAPGFLGSIFGSSA